MADVTVYVKAFLHPSHRVPPDLGLAIKLHVEDPDRKCPTAKFLYYLLTHSPAPKGITNEILRECEFNDFVRPVVAQIRDPSPAALPPIQQWVDEMFQALPRQPSPPTDTDTGVLAPVNRLASHYLTHLGLGVEILDGPRTPQTSSHPSPNLLDLSNLTLLLSQAKQGRQSSLKEITRLRDGNICPATTYDLDPEPGGVIPELAHIIPYSAHQKPQTLAAIEMFTGAQITANDVVEYINDPRNALLLDPNAHGHFDRRFSWGIEAVAQPDGKVKYYIRAIRGSRFLPPGLKNREDQELVFGLGPLGNGVDLPDPKFCNLKLNVARVMFASGAADVLEKFFRDREDAQLMDAVLGSIPQADDTFFNHLEFLAMMTC